MPDHTVCESVQLLPHSPSRHAVEKQAALLLIQPFTKGSILFSTFSHIFLFIWIFPSNMYNVQVFLVCADE